MARTVGSTGERTAQAIVEAANQLFAERGYAAVSMRTLAQRVGIQVGALYNHFQTKQDVLATMMRRHMEELLAAWDDAYDAGDPPLQALESFTRFHVRYHMDRHNEVFIAFMELRSLEDENFQAVEALRKAYEYRVRDILRQGQEQGVFNISDPHVSAMALIAMLTGVTTWFKPGGRLSTEQIEEIYVGLTMQAVGAKQDAPAQ